MRQYRRGARFVMDARAHCRPLNRNERARILYLAEQLERRTKAPGARSGVLGLTGLEVLRALVLRFHRRSDGMCCPSYLDLQAATKLCVQTIANALKRLEACGILRIMRRLVRERIDGVLTVRQASNLYAVGEPAPHAERLPTSTPRVRQFPSAAYAGLAKLLGWRADSTRKRETYSEVFSRDETLAQ